MKKETIDQATPNTLPPDRTGDMLQLVMPKLQENIREYFLATCRQRINYLFVGFSPTRVITTMNGNPELALARLGQIKDLLEKMIENAKAAQALKPNTPLVK